MDLSRLVIDGGTFRRTGSAPFENPGDPLGGGALIFGSWRGDDNFDTMGGEEAIMGRRRSVSRSPTAVVSIKRRAAVVWCLGRSPQCRSYCEHDNRRWDG